MAELTRHEIDAAAREGRLAAAMLAAPPIESELNGAVYALTIATLENALGHAHHAERARERAREVGR